MAAEPVETTEASALQRYHFCPMDASELIWQEIPDCPGEWAWCCPECPYVE